MLVLQLHYMVRKGGISSWFMLDVGSSGNAGKQKSPLMIEEVGVLISL